MNLQIQARKARCGSNKRSFIHVPELRALLDHTMEATAFVPQGLSRLADAFFSSAERACQDAWDL